MPYDGFYCAYARGHHACTPHTLELPSLFSDQSRSAEDGPPSQAADQRVTDAELTAVLGAVRGLTAEQVSDDVVQVPMEKYAQLLTEQGVDKRLEAIAELLDPIEAQNAFALAAAVGLADDQIVAAENSVIAKMRRAFGISSEKAEQILGELARDL